MRLEMDKSWKITLLINSLLVSLTFYITFPYLWIEVNEVMLYNYVSQFIYYSLDRI